MALTNTVLWVGSTPPSDTQGEGGRAEVITGTLHADFDTAVLPADWQTKWQLANGVAGTGTIVVAANNSTLKATADSWKGTVELASYTATDNVAIYLANMGNAGSKIVLKGLVNNSTEANHGPYIAPADGSTVNAEVVIEGDVTFGAGNSGKTQTLKKISGSGNLTFAYTGSHSYYINDVSEYTGTIASMGSSTVYLGVPSTPEIGDLIAKVDSANDKVSTSITVGSEGAKATGELNTVEEVYGLYVVAEATINDTSYATLASAIEAAKEGDTITLSSAVTEATITVDKDLTIDFNAKAANLGGIVINEGKTLTISRANSSSNVIPSITGGGNLVVSNSNTFQWKGLNGTSTLASITQTSSTGGILIAGHGTINVTDDVSVNATLTFTPDSAEPSYISDGFTIKMTANSVSAGTLNGGATIETVEGTTVGAGTFYGPISGGVAASGNFTSQGAGLDGTIAVADGKTLTIGNRLASMTNKRFHLDATDSSTYTLEEGTSNLSVIKGQYNYSLVSGKTAAVLKAGDETHFGRKPYFQFNDSQYYYGNKVAVYSLIAVTQPDQLSGCLARYVDGNNSQDRFGISSSAWFARQYNANYDAFIYQNGQANNRTAVAGQDTIVSYLHNVVTTGNRADTLCHEYQGAIAEYVGFSSRISVEDRVACEMYLMEKWNLAAAANYRPFASTAEVELGTGATLDLGGYTQTVASFTGGGTVQNGTLLTTGNTYTDTGALTLPAVENMTVVLDEGATALTITGDAAGIKVVASEAFAANPSDVTITATGLTGGNTIDFTGVPSLFRYGVTDNEDGTWTIAKATTFEAATYIWSPVGSSTDWSSCANWKVGEQAVAMLPQSVDTVVFPASEEPGFTGWTVALGENRTVASATFNTDVTLSDAILFSSGYTGEGTITLGDDAGLANNETEVTIANDIVIAGSGAHTNILYSYKKDLTVSGGLSGSGNVELKVQYDQQGVKLTGANTMTSGSITAKSTLGAASGSGRRNCSKVKATATNAALVWQLSIGASVKSGNIWAFFQDSNATYRFGSVGASSIGDGGYASGNVYEIGALGLDDTLSGNLTYSSRWSSANTIKKVGDGDLSVTMSTINSYDVNSGTLTLKSDSSRPYDTGTIIFTGTGTLVLDDDFTVDVSTNIAAGAASSTVAAKVDTGSTARTWEAALAGIGLVKSGTGTLTLAEPAATTFTITVTEEGGKVVVPTGSYKRGTHTKVESTADGKDTLVYTEEEDPAPSSGLDPAAAEPTYVSTATTKDAAIAAAKGAVVVPAGAASNYADCFKYTVTGTSGAYTVTITGIADEVEDGVCAAVAAAVAAGGSVAVPAGLWYKFTPYAELGGEAGTATSGQSNGTAVSVDKVGSTQGFYKVEIGAAEIK